MKRFSCHGCSGCCHGAISLTYDEAIYEFPNYFPLTIAYVVSDVRNVPVEKQKDRYSKSMKKLTKDTTGFYDKTSTNRKIVVHPQVLSLVPPDHPCNMLDENKLCTTYERKPKVCTLYPFRIDTPIAFVEEGLTRERNIAYEGSTHIPCKGWDDESPIIAINQVPTDNSVIPMLNERFFEAKKTRDLLKLYFLELKKDDEYIKKIDQFSQLNDQSGRVVQSTFNEFIYWLVASNNMHPSVGVSLVLGQETILKEMLSKISDREDDVGTTFIGIYEKYIKNSRDVHSRLTNLL